MSDDYNDDVIPEEKWWYDEPTEYDEGDDDDWCTEDET